MTIETGTEIAGRFRIVATVGAGGMGVVYRARDLRLGRDVAIKVLPPELATNPDRVRRFEREARAAAALSHPNLVELHDVGEHDGTTYLVSELLEGENLRRRLAAGSLPPEEVVRLGAQIARGLAAAHAAGIVHRDLKPENLFVTAEGTVKILDFGLASLRVNAVGDDVATEAPTATAVTRAGEVLGTAGYMAPEQLRGQPTDQRADLFAFGCVLYEMLTGRRAFAGSTTAETPGAVLKDDPAPIASTVPGVPPTLTGIVSRCLEKRPERRATSAHDLAVSLEALQRREATGQISDSPSPPLSHRWTRLVTLAVVASIAVAAVVWYRGRPEGESSVPPPDPSRVMVAPFENLTGDPSLDALGLMAADAITEGLQQVGDTEVVPAGGPEGTTTATSDPDDWADIARQRGAGLLVTGALYMTGETLELRTRITDSENGELLYALDPDVGPPDAARQVVAAARDRVMGAVAYHNSAIRGMLNEPLRYRAVREFQAGMTASGTDWPAAVAHFERVVELEPDCWMARIRLAIVLRMIRSAEAEARADRLWEEITAHEAELSPVELLFVKFAEARNRGNLVESLVYARQLRALTPGDEIMAVFSGMNALRVNRPREALSLLGDIDEFDWSRWGRVPQGEWLLSFFATAHHLLGEYGEELEVAERALRLYPNSLQGRVHEVRALAALGRMDDLERGIEASFTVPPGRDSPGTVMLEAALALRTHGHPAEALPMAQRAVSWFAARPPETLNTAGIDTWSHLSGHAYSLWVAGRDDEARRVGEAWAVAFPESSGPRGFLGMVAARAGDRATAHAVDAELERIDETLDVRWAFYWRATITAHEGDIERAFELLREAFAHGLRFELYLHQHLGLEPLAGYPPYEELLAAKG